VRLRWSMGASGIPTATTGIQSMLLRDF